MIRKIRSMTEAAGGRIPAARADGVRARRRTASTPSSAGFQMHLAKPVDPDHFLAVVANLARMAAELKREREEERSS